MHFMDAKMPDPDMLKILPEGASPLLRGSTAVAGDCRLIRRRMSPRNRLMKPGTRRDETSGSPAAWRRPARAPQDATTPGAWTQQTERHAVRVTVLTDGLEHPWSLAFLPDGRMLVTERPGRLRYVEANGTLDPTPIGGLPAAVAETGQGGLHDVALHPDFARNRFVYIAYAGRKGRRYGTELARGRLEGHRLEDVEVLFRALPKSSGGSPLRRARGARREGARVPHPR